MDIILYNFQIHIILKLQLIPSFFSPSPRCLGGNSFSGDMTKKSDDGLEAPIVLDTVTARCPEQAEGGRGSEGFLEIDPSPLVTGPGVDPNPPK